MSRNVLMSRQNTSQYRDTAYIERANARWEAWTYSEGLRYRLPLPLGCDKPEAIRHLHAKKYDVVVVK